MADIFNECQFFRGGFDIYSGVRVGGQGSIFEGESANLEVIDFLWKRGT